MRTVTSPTSIDRNRKTATRTWFRLLVAVSAVLGLVAVSAPVGNAESLSDQRSKVRKALAQTKSNISEAEDDLAQASAKLEDSETKLAKARQQLTYVKSKLAKARARDAEIAKQLKAAEKELVAAQEKVAKGEAELAAQQALIGDVARTAYQQQTNLVSFQVLLDSENMTEVTDRAQWTDLIFGTTTGELTRLQQLQVALEQAKADSEKARAAVAEQRRRSLAQVAEVKQLAKDAAAQEAEVKSLVAANAQVRDERQDDLEESRADYDKLEAQDASISKKIAAQAAREKAAREKAARSKAARAAQAAADAKANAKGFIRPVDANPGSKFGLRFHPILHYWRMHWGLDFGARCGAPLYAMADGKVSQVLTTSHSNGLGNWTVINYGVHNGHNITSGYAHQSKIVVRPGQKVKQGQLVGYVGSTGLSTGCHLHLQIYKDGARVNPASYI